MFLGNALDAALMSHSNRCSYARLYNIFSAFISSRKSPYKTKLSIICRRFKDRLLASLTQITSTAVTDKIMSTPSITTCRARSVTPSVATGAIAPTSTFAITSATQAHSHRHIPSIAQGNSRLSEIYCFSESEYSARVSLWNSFTYMTVGLMRFRVVDVPGAGDCLFWCFATPSMSHLQIRAEVVSFIRHYINEGWLLSLFAAMDFSISSITDYVDILSKTGACGSFFDILICAFRWSLDINIVTGDR